MRVAIFSVGTWGDVLPFAGLAASLEAAGHRVTLAVPARFGPRLRALGTRVHPLPVDLATGWPRRLTNGGTSRALSVTMAYNQLLVRQARPLLESMVEAAREADILLLSPALWIGEHIAEAFRLPSLGVFLQPITPTTEFPPWLLTRHQLAGRVGRAAAQALLDAAQGPFRRPVDELRDRLGLPPLRSRTAWVRRMIHEWPVLHGYSPAVLPAPRDWPAGHRPVGYWWPPTDPGWRPPADLEAFLADGPRPVYLGFGSMPLADPDRVSRLVGDALRRTGLRAVVGTGWGGLAVHPGMPPDGDVLAVGDVPHAWLFERVAAVVHHGGAGTTAAALRAGVPAVTVPFMFDQYLWADRLARLGAAAPPIPFRSLRADRLAAALLAVVADPGYRRRAEGLSRRLAEEDGAGAVATALAAG